jgi:hypothetical protein
MIIEKMEMKQLTIFSWGYWGWGSSAAQFVTAADAVEAARGLKPPVFVDIRIQRSVRAVNFSGDSFKKIVGEERYLWMPGLGNLAIRDRSLGRIAIKEPKEAETLLDLAIECQRGKRRVIFYCACEVPGACHRYEVGNLLLKAARRRGIPVEVVEWPGGEPQEVRIGVTEGALKKMKNGAQTLSLPPDADVLKYTGLPWGSVVEITGDGERLCFISGPAIYKKGQWVLPVVFCHDWFEDPGKARQLALKEYRSKGYAPRPGRGL